MITAHGCTLTLINGAFSNRTKLQLVWRLQRPSVRTEMQEVKLRLEQDLRFAATCGHWIASRPRNGGEVVACRVKPGRRSLNRTSMDVRRARGAIKDPSGAKSRDVYGRTDTQEEKMLMVVSW